VFRLRDSFRPAFDDLRSSSADFPVAHRTELEVAGVVEPVEVSARIAGDVNFFASTLVQVLVFPFADESVHFRQDAFFPDFRRVDKVLSFHDREM
jgi:hypothetical protein